MEVHDAMSPAKPAMFMEDGGEETTRSFVPNGGGGGGHHQIESDSDERMEQQQETNRIVQSRLSILDEHILNDVSDLGQLYASDPASGLSRQCTDASASSSAWQQQQDEQQWPQQQQQLDDEKKQPPTQAAVAVTKISSKVDPITLKSAYEDMHERDELDKQRLTNTRMSIVQDHVFNGVEKETSNWPEPVQVKREAMSKSSFPGAVHISDADSKNDDSAYSRKGARAKGDGYYKEKGSTSPAAAMQQQEEEADGSAEDRIVRARMSILGEHVFLDGSESGGSDPVPEDRGSGGKPDGQNAASLDDDYRFAQSLSLKDERDGNSAIEWSKREAGTLSQLPPYHSNDNEKQKAEDDGKIQEDKRTEQFDMFEGEAAVSLAADFAVPETKLLPQEMALPYKDKEDLEQGTERLEELITAKPVDEEDFEVKLEKEMEDRIKSQTVMALAVAEEADEVEIEAPKVLWRRYRLPCICLIIVLGGVAIALGITLGGGSGPSGQFQVSPPSSAPTPSPTFSDEAFLREILSLATSEEALVDPSTPQHQALQWLLTKDPAGLPVRDTNPERLLERYILVVLYGATGGDGWVDNSDFLSEKSVCEWYGIFCGNENSIVNLDFSDNNLNGTLPSEIVALPLLEKLFVSNNTISGKIPMNLGSLSQLDSLLLNDNNFSGIIPESFNRLTNLEQINLSNNMLHGGIPSGLTRIVALEKLDLSSNMLNSTIPAFAAHMGTRELNLYDNRLRGSIPESVYSLKALEKISLYSNVLTGTLSSQIGVLRNLEFLHFENNLIEGTLPSELGALENLQEFWVSENMLSGQISTYFGRLQRPSVLHLDNNQLTGPLPSELGKMNSLADLSVGTNSITGSIPSEVHSLKKLSKLNVKQTDLAVDALTLFCNGDDSASVFIEADCAGSTPEVTCPCCAICCDDATNECGEQ